MIQHPIGGPKSPATLPLRSQNFRLIKKDIIQSYGPHQVDDDQWYQVRLSSGAAEWTRNQNSEWWWEHSNAYKWFDIHEKLYMLLVLKFA